MSENKDKKLIEILRSIQKPSGAYSCDPIVFRNNVIDFCANQAKKGLEILSEA